MIFFDFSRGGKEVYGGEVPCQGSPPPTVSSRRLIRGSVRRETVSPSHPTVSLSHLISSSHLTPPPHLTFSPHSLASSVHNTSPPPPRSSRTQPRAPRQPPRHPPPRRPLRARRPRHSPPSTSCGS